LGCVLGSVSSFMTSNRANDCCRYGLLHRIPPPASHLKAGGLPSDLLEAEEEDEELFVPADNYENGHAHRSESHDHDTEYSHTNGFGSISMSAASS
jgi:hypothetical protein